jgi:hypothetical protein
MKEECTTRYDDQLGQIPQNESQIIYLDEEHQLDLPSNEFIVVVDRFPKGGKFTQIITVGRLSCLHKACKDRNHRWNNHIDEEEDGAPFLTEEEIDILVEANKGIIRKVPPDGCLYTRSRIETVNGAPFYYELAEKCCERANELSRKRKD